MRQMFKKLHNQRGVSILVALVFFLVCSMVAAVILGSATTNAQKLQRQKESAQVYYSVSSAAQLVRNTIARLSMTGSESVTHYSCQDLVIGGTSDITKIEPDQEPDVTKYDGVKVLKNGGEQTDPDALLSLLEEGVEQVYKSKLQFAQKTPFTSWTKTFTLYDGHYMVEAEVTIESDYSLTIRLQPQDEKWKDDYSTVLLCTGKASDPALSSQTTPNNTHTLTYEDLHQGTSPTQQFDCIATTTTYTTTISWEPGMIYKGAASHE